MQNKRETKTSNPWSFYAAGVYNNTYLSSSALKIGDHICTWVLKIPKTTGHYEGLILSNKDRFLRKYRTINSKYPIFETASYKVQLLGETSKTDILPKVIYLHLGGDAKICSTYINKTGHTETLIIHERLSPDMVVKYSGLILANIGLMSHDQYYIIDIMGLQKPGVIVPYFGKIQANDHEIASKVLDIYINTRNIIADATIAGNFLRHEDETICVDLDCALKRDSMASKAYMTREISHQFEQLWNSEYLKYPCTIDTIRTLFYLEENLTTDAILDEYLTPELLRKFNICRQKMFSISTPDIHALIEIVRYYPEHQTHEDQINISLLNEIQLSTADDRQQVILAAFSKEPTFEQKFYDRWAENPPISIDELSAMAQHTSAPFGFFNTVSEIPDTPASKAARL